jgi:hypothetical protein
MLITCPFKSIRQKVLKTDYLMADETPIPVQTKDKPGATHKGYHWVYYNPLSKTVLFNYQKSRGREGPDGLLKNCTGYLQTDGYKSYNSLSNKAHIMQLACWAHARRYFEKVLDNDKKNQKQSIFVNITQTFYSQLYMHCKRICWIRIALRRALFGLLRASQCRKMRISQSAHNLHPYLVSGCGSKGKDI